MFKSFDTVSWLKSLKRHMEAVKRVKDFKYQVSKQLLVWSLDPFALCSQAKKRFYGNYLWLGYKNCHSNLFTHIKKSLA